MTGTIETKAAFARRLNVHRSAVAHWIKDGKLSREPGGGLVDHNDKEQIDVPAALEKLQITLDPGQGLGNGAQTQAMLNLSESDDEASEPPETAKPSIPRPANPDAERYNAARADRAELDANMARLAYEREMGNWVNRAEAEAETRREATKLIGQVRNIVEQALPVAVAEALGTDPAPTLAAIRTAFRAEMTALSKRLSTEAESLESPQTESAHAA